MDYNEVLQRRVERIGPKCKVCPGATVSAATTRCRVPAQSAGNGANDNLNLARGRWS